MVFYENRGNMPYRISLNVLQWCADWYGEKEYKRGDCIDPTGPTAGSRRVSRGGGWIALPKLYRSASRSSRTPSLRDSIVGFRVALQVGP